MKQKLPADIFMQIHRSFVVNLPPVDGLAGNMVMIGKQKLPVSKPNRSWRKKKRNKLSILVILLQDFILLLLLDELFLYLCCNSSSSGVPTY